MHRLLIILLLFVAVEAYAQESTAYLAVDSITSQCYLSANWDKLISAGNEAIAQSIDYKKLRQRMGYAYYMKADYYAAQSQYQRALTFDSSDQDTQTYLYFCNLNIGNETSARYHASKLTRDVKQSLGIKAFKLINAVDAEYNYKANNSTTRSNPVYYRIGAGTQLSNRLSIYQAASQYSEIIHSTNLIKQTEYYLLANWSVSSHVTLNVAYHYLYINGSGSITANNMYYAKLSTNINRVNFALSGSIMNTTTDNIEQLGALVGVTLPGKPAIHLSSTLTGMFETDNNRLVYSQAIGAHVLKPLWAEASITFGNLQNYNEADGLYVYNTYDATIFRSGITLFWNIGKRITLVGNYTYDTKQITNDTNQLPYDTYHTSDYPNQVSNYTNQMMSTNTHYNQHSFSGGIICKL